MPRDNLPRERESNTTASGLVVKYGTKIQIYSGGNGEGRPPVQPGANIDAEVFAF